MTESNQIENGTDVGVTITTEEPDFFDTVALEIVNSEESNIPAEDASEDEPAEDEAKDSNSNPKNVPAQNTRRKESANERIRQLVDRAKAAEDKYQASQERLTFANEKIASLEKLISDYEAVIKEFESFRDSILNGEIPRKGTSTDVFNGATERPLTRAEALKLFEEKKLEEANAEKARKENERRSSEIKQVQTMWEPHVKRIKDDKFPAEQREFMIDFVGSLDKHPQRSNREQLIKIVGKYQHAPEILFGLYKKPGFESQTLAEMIEDAIKLNNKIIQQKSKVTQSKATNNGETTGGAVRSSGKAKNYEEYLRRKYAKK